MNEYSQMVSELVKPGQDILATLTPAMAHTLHMAIGISGEVAELKEHQVKAAVGEDIEHSSILEELGDIEFYFEGICQSMGVTIGRVNTTKASDVSVDQLVVVAGELLDMVKKMAIYNQQIELMNFINQLITLRATLDRVYVYYDIAAQVAQDYNMDKLIKGSKARYKEGKYSDKAAQYRADKEV